MASTDWADLTGNLVDDTEILRGVSPGLGAPPGASNTFVHVARTVSASIVGAWGRHIDQANFAPMALGGSSRGVLRAVPFQGQTPGVAPLLFVALQTANVASVGYLLGIVDGAAPRIALVKGQLVNGIADVPPGTLGVLRRSDAAIEVGSWQHLRLDAVANTNGDVVLNVFRNDLAVHTVDDPSWAPIPGMGQVIDDFAMMNTGSAPLVGGYAGFGARHAGSGAACIDHAATTRQT